MNTTTNAVVAQVLAGLPIDTQDVLADVAQRGAARNEREIRAQGLVVPQIDNIDMEDLYNLLGRAPTAAEQLLVGQCMRAIVHGI